MAKKKKQLEISMIACIAASAMPDDVQEYCEDKGIYTHCADNIVFVSDDDNPFANWLRANGYTFKNENENVDGPGDLIAVLGT